MREVVKNDKSTTSKRYQCEETRKGEQIVSVPSIQVNTKTRITFPRTNILNYFLLDIYRVYSIELLYKDLIFYINILNG